jgi:hypothetical protein
MSTTAKKAILKALIEGVIMDLMVKTNVENVYIDESTTLAAKLSEIITALNNKVNSSTLENYSTTSQMNTAISEAIAEVIGGAPETYDTLKELATYIANHEDVVESLNEAIGSKASKSTVEAIQATINGLGTLSQLNVIGENNLDDALKAKLNAASENGHTHSNKALLDTYDQTNANIKAAVEAKHSHTNKSVLDGITSSKVEAWTSKGKFYASETQPSGLTANDLWAQIVN